ncbi:hypothetical protein B2J93_3577 [Marssonina coronariae]|uniref:DUF7082 domain-containing protein n=1 Tax=Diplocarpon coronariae TaxID=2795749 RepID=A0A218Z4F3_9HELO|nr:hypothetical protein B2J93_3577 [Marssonina coronariae]
MRTGYLADNQTDLRLISQTAATAPPAPAVPFNTVKVAYSTYRLFEPAHPPSSRPIILDDSYASPETAALHEEGYEGALVARVDSPRESLSMAAYGKAQLPQLHGGYDAGRSYPENTFSYAAPNYHGSQPPGPAPTPGQVYQNATQLTPMGYPPHQVRAPYDDHSGPYLNVGTTIPEVTSYTPRRGSRATKVYVYMNSLYELMTEDSTPHFFLMFGQRKCPASLQKISQQGAVCSYALTAETPAYGATGWSSPTVPIWMWMESGEEDSIGKIDVGDFTYIDGQRDAAPENSSKRKLSIDSADLMRSPPRRSSSQQVRAKDEYGSYGYGPSEATATYSPYLQPSHSYAKLAPQYNRPGGSFPGQPSRHLAYGYPGPGTTSPPTLRAPSPPGGNWPPYSTGAMVRSPGVAQSGLGLSRTATSSLPPSATQGTPILIRTSTLQQTPSPATTPHGPLSHFSAYSLYPHKAKIEISGELDDMIAHWTKDEWESKRRLVHFQRSQAGSTITTTFQPVSPEERDPNSICISCIYWEEKGECFITSVDTIYLLERLVNVKFTVQEKNRIRRNLEGFRPLTVSKGKADSEEFFKVVMAFPAPKPRNIEKDVKVFYWKDLAAALKKIIGKYSASPSSTMPQSLQTPVSAPGYAAEGSTAGLPYAGEHHGGGGVSPPSISGSTSSAYASKMPARILLSPPDAKAMALLGGPPDLRVSFAPNAHEAPSHWQGGQHHMQPHSYPPPLQNQHGHRGSWDMYLENAATAGGTASALHHPGSTATLHYPAVRSAADPAARGEHRIARPLSAHQQHGQQMSRT